MHNSKNEASEKREAGKEILGDQNDKYNMHTCIRAYHTLQMKKEHYMLNTFEFRMQSKQQHKYSLCSRLTNDWKIVNRKREGERKSESESANGKRKRKHWIKNQRRKKKNNNEFT